MPNDRGFYAKFTYDLPPNDHDREDAERRFRRAVNTDGGVKGIVEDSVGIEHYAHQQSWDNWQTTYFVSGRVVLNADASGDDKST